MPEYHDLFGGQGPTIVAGGRARKRTILTKDRVEELLTQAYALTAKRWAGFIVGDTAGFISPDFTDGIAAIYFIRAKYQGAEYPRWLSLVFTPRQICTSSGDGRHDGGSVHDLLGKIAKTADRPLVDSFRWLIGDSTVFLHFTSVAGLAIRGHRMPLDFPAALAAEIMDKYCPQGGAVLDPCHGWGGRLIGFLLANKPRHYVGVDPSNAAHDGAANAFDALGPYAEDGKTAQFMLSPFETAKIKGPFDLAITSPPYFDVEKYEGKLQSFRQYRTFEAWCEGFYRPLFKRTSGLLKMGGHFALNVGSQTYPLVEKAKEFAPEYGFELIHSKTALMAANYSGTSTARSESLFVFRKA